MSPETPTLREPAPRPLLVAAAVTALEGLVSIGFGVAETLHISSERLVMGVTTSLFFFLFGGVLIACARGLTRLRSGGRGPVMIAQLIFLGLAWNFREGDTWPVSIALAVPAAVVLVGMLHPRTIAVLNGFDLADEDGPAPERD